MLSDLSSMLAHATSVATIVSPLIACVGVFLVLKQLKKDGLSASANAVSAAYNSISKSIDEVGSEDDIEAKSYKLREVFNQLEMACALKRDGQFGGKSGKLAVTLLGDVIKMIIEDEMLLDEFNKASHGKSTFKNIKAVMAEMGITVENQKPQTKKFMQDRPQVAEIVYKDYKELHRATFDTASQYGRWLLASLLLIHGGALFGLFTFLSDVADKPEALRLYQWTVWWFVGGIMLTLSSGLMAWLNWSMHSDNYDGWANKPMLWDPDVWVGETRHTWGIDVTNWAALVLGVLASLCIVGGAYSTLNGKWVQSVVTAVA